MGIVFAQPEPFDASVAQAYGAFLADQQRARHSGGGGGSAPVQSGGGWGSGGGGVSGFAQRDDHEADRISAMLQLKQMEITHQEMGHVNQMQASLGEIRRQRALGYMTEEQANALTTEVQRSLLPYHQRMAMVEEQKFKVEKEQRQRDAQASVFSLQDPGNPNVRLPGVYARRNNGEIVRVDEGTAGEQAQQRHVASYLQHAADMVHRDMATLVAEIRRPRPASEDGSPEGITSRRARIRGATPRWFPEIDPETAPQAMVDAAMDREIRRVSRDHLRRAGLPIPEQLQEEQGRERNSPEQLRAFQDLLATLQPRQFVGPPERPAQGSQPPAQGAPPARSFWQRYVEDF